MKTENLSKVVVSLYLIKDVYKNNHPTRMMWSDKAFDEFKEMGFSHWLEKPSAIMTYFKVDSVYEEVAYVVSPDSQFADVWVDFEVPVDEWIKVLNGERNNNGFYFNVDVKPHCTYEVYYSRECDDKTKAPKLVMIYGGVTSTSEIVKSSKNILDITALGNKLFITFSGFNSTTSGNIVIADMRGRILFDKKVEKGVRVVNLEKEMSVLGRGNYIISADYGSMKKSIIYKN